MVPPSINIINKGVGDMIQFSITKIFTWVILVVVLLMAFNGYVVTKQFAEFQIREAERSAMTKEQHAEQLKELTYIHQALNDIRTLLKKDIEIDHKLVDKLSK